MRTVLPAGGGLGRNLPGVIISIVALLVFFEARAANLIDAPALGLRVARGFRVTLYADSTLADNIYAMTIDAGGNVVVTGPGYIRTLHDANGDGVAETATEYASPSTGGMGICCAGNELYLTGEGFVQRYVDANGDGMADGPPTMLLPLNFTEHGGHAIRKGPDGLWYVIAGNETKFGASHITHAGSPVRRIEGGALLRFSSDGKTSEAIAHGFRNPCDFDFNSYGDIFTCDSDCEGDYLLPWYTPTRLYHVGYGGHHGWRLNGWTRSWARPGYYFDTVEILAELGRGSPTGVACYRHFQFPVQYRNGVFFADWTFGRILFAPLEAAGATYGGATETFMEPIGTHGFAPNDLAVGPDGSLFISTGGRKTRGAVYRVQYVDGPVLLAEATNWMRIPADSREAVLEAPQPLDAWSRAYWEPIALRVGREAFDEAVADGRAVPQWRLRAIEIVTQLFGGLTPAAAAAGARANSPFVRARIAWSLGRIPCDNYPPILLGLARDAAPIVRRFAMEAIADHASELDAVTLQAAVAANLTHPDKRLRQATARLASLLPEPAWNALWAQQLRATPISRLTTTLAGLWRAPEATVQTNAIDSALGVLAQSRLAGDRLEAIRLIILALGDYHLDNPSIELYTGYEPALSLAGEEARVAKVRKAVGGLFPSGDAEVDLEAARLLAMIEADDPALSGKMLSLIKNRSSAAADFHYLTALSRLKTQTNAAPRLASAILGLHRKLGGQEQRAKQNWNGRLGELVQAWLRREPALADAILKQPNFAAPGNLPIALGLGSDRFVIGARLYWNTLQRDLNFPWSAALIDLLSALPLDETLPLFRRQWDKVALRDRLLLEMARRPEIIDRDKFIAGLNSVQPDVVRASMGGLLALPRDESMKALLPAMRILRRALNDPKEQITRAQTILLVNHQAGQNFKIREAAGDPARAYQLVFDWFALNYPSLVPQLDPEDAESQGKWNYIFKSVPWNKGEAARGEPIFASRCGVCHSGPAALGPDLGGVAQRLSPPELFNTIVFPSREIAPPYRQTTFTTRGGESYTGLIAFESAEGIILQTGAGVTVRLAGDYIVSRVPSPLSPMPSGLLEGLRAQEIADLHAYLKTLPARHGGE